MCCKQVVLYTASAALGHPLLSGEARQEEVSLRPQDFPDRWPVELSGSSYDSALALPHLDDDKIYHESRG